MLQRYHSPQLAGLAALVSLLPGLLLSPIGGALLDRYGRVPLITVDYVFAAVSVFLIAGLSAAHSLPPALLLLICGIASVTGPLSAAGGRSLFPIVVPAPLWERANALDSMSFVITSLVGAPTAGILVGAAGGEWALAFDGVLWALSAIAMIRVHDPSARQPSGHVLRDAWGGIAYVLRNRALAGIALTLGTWSIGWGILTIALPVLILGPLHQGPQAVGLLLGLNGAAGVVSGLVSGRLRTQGRERRLMAGSMVACAVAAALFPLAGTVALVAVGILLFGAANGPFDIAFITLRQRRTDPAAYGRVFAVSMALNSVGSPLGAALAGPLIGRSLQLALWAAVVAIALSAIFPLAVIPTDE